MRWRLIIKEYGSNMEYIEGPENIVADTPSRLELEPKIPTFNSQTEQYKFYEEQIMTTIELPKKTMPISYEHIHIH